MLSPLKSTTTESAGPIHSSTDLRAGHKLPAVPLMMMMMPFVCPIGALTLSVYVSVSVSVAGSTSVAGSRSGHGYLFRLSLLIVDFHR